MSVVDNRTHLQDCESNGDLSADTTMGATASSALSGTVLEGTNSQGFQCDDAQEVLLWDADSAGSAFNVDMSDMTVYLNVKHNLGETFANLGGLIAFCDTAAAGGGDIIGYTVNGSDVAGFPYRFRFTTIKLDVSVIVASPGTDDVDYFTYAGTEANLDHTGVIQIGYGTFNIVKAVSSALNAWMDGIYYDTNGDYCASIQGGTSGTPETMADVVGDDETDGMGMFNNPKGTEYGFFAPTEWGDAAADSYFTSDGEQWYFIGDNQGGHTVGTGHFPFRLVGDSGSTNSWVLTSTVIVNTGTVAQFDMSHVDMDTATMDGCSLIGFDTIELPDAGTAKTTLACIFSDCNTVTSNGGDMTGSSVLVSTVVADTGALVWNESSDTDGFLDEMTFSTGAAAHHAIDFGTAVTSDITLRGVEFTGFGTSEDGNDAALRFLAGSGSLNCNLVDCTVGGAIATSANLFKDDAAGIEVTLVFDPVVTKVTVEEADGTMIENARVFLETADDGGTGFPYQDAVTTLVQAAGTATLTASAVHDLATGDQVVVRGATIEGYNRVVSITVTSTTIFTYSVDSGLGSPAGGTPVFSYVPIHGLTDSNGEIETSKTWSVSQSLSGWARKSTSAPFFAQTAISIADASGGTDLLLALQSDE